MRRGRIEESVELITEMLSISSSVSNAVERIFQDVEGYYKDLATSNIGDNFYLRTGAVSYQIWGHDLTLKLVVYDFWTEEAFNKYNKALVEQNAYNFTTNELYLTIVLIYGHVYRAKCEGAIYHELEHLYQLCASKRKDPDYKRLTDNAYGLANYQMKVGETLEDKKVGVLMYYSNPREQDAYAHEYYSQARNSLGDFLNHTTDIDKMFRRYREFTKWFDDSFDDPNFKKYLEPYRQYGYNPKNMKVYIDNGFNRFKNKLNHVRALVHSTVDDPNAHKKFGQADVDETKDERVREMTERVMDAFIELNERTKRGVNFLRDRHEPFQNDFNFRRKLES